MGCEKRLSLSLFCINENNNLNLPRQARGNHRENSEKRDDAFVSFAGALWDIYETRKDAIYGDEADDSITIRNPNSKFSVRETHFTHSFAAFCTKDDHHFTKTGSGQT